MSTPPRSMVFIPAYRASATIDDLLSRIPQSVWDIVEEIFVQDNHSDDGTFERALKYKERHSVDKLRVYRMERNLGYGGSEKRAITYAIDRGIDYLAVLHADGQYPADRLEELLSKLDHDGCVMVQGSRAGHVDGGMPRYKAIANWSLNKLESAAFGYDLREYHSGFRAYSCKAMENLPYTECSDGHGVTADMVAMFRRCGLSVGEIEVPTYYGDEVSHTSPWTSIRYGLGVIGLIGQYYLARSGLYVTPKLKLPDPDGGPQVTGARRRASGQDE